MVLRVILFVFMALGLAGFASVAWISMHPQPATHTAEVAFAPAKARILVAAHTLRPGVLLKPDDLAVAEVNPASVPAGARTDTPAARADLLGAMVRRTIADNEPVLAGQVMRAGERGFLAAVLQPGFRAITVGVDAVSGTAGLIWPGDHVDLILTETLGEQDTPVGRRIAGETFLHNVRVIAIDQDLMQGATASNIPGSAAPSQSRTVTLEVSPENAERVAVASRLGHLSLSVISADAAALPGQGPEPADPARGAVTWGGDVSAALQGGKRAPDQGTGTLHVYEGGAEPKEVHF